MNEVSEKNKKCKILLLASERIRKTRGLVKKGFTLAEVLITLGIIGVVAALTMPSLIAKHKEKETVVKLKKFHSIMSQAYQLAVVENGTPDNWDLGGRYDVQGGRNILNNLAPYLKLQKKCEDNTGCFPNVMYKSLHGSDYGNINAIDFMSKAILADGTTFFVYVTNPECDFVTGQSDELRTVCGYMDVDINGFKPPNRWGKDLFVFTITKYGISPVGMPAETLYSFSSHCKNMEIVSSLNGNACTAWVIYNENMDYMHCDDLSWTGKTKCK